MAHQDETHDPLSPHSHEPNPAPPTADPTIRLVLPNGRSLRVDIGKLKSFPRRSLSNCYIVSTGHGTSGPFTFSGVPLLSVIDHFWANPWAEVEVISADGFGNRVLAKELHQPDPAGPIVLAYAIDGRAMSREEGLVRMIVPSERDDALRQVKWVGELRIKRP